MSVPVIYFDLGNTLVYGPTGDKQPFDDAVATIYELWERGYRIGLLSDQQEGTTIAEVRTKLGDYGLEAGRFDVITISSEFNPPIYKPDPQIFQAALTKAGYIAASDETVFVTESLDHIEAARDLGWRAIHKPYGSSCTSASGECVSDLDDLLALFPPLEVDLYIRDAPSDPGDDDFTGSVFWNSPDMWIRHSEDGGTTHQNPEAGQDNWLYTRVHNRGVGIARILWVGWAVKEWAGTQFVYSADYLPYLIYAFGVNVDPGDSTIVHAKWPAGDVPPAGTHACWLAAAHQNTDQPASGAHVWEHNNLAQKNLAIVEAAPGETGEFSVVLGSRAVREARYYTLEIHRAREHPEMPVVLVGQSGRALEKLVRAGREFSRRPATPVVKRDDVAFRFLDSARVELTGVEAQEGRVTLDLEAGSTLNLSRRPEPADPSRRRPVPKFAAAGLVKDVDGGAAIDFAPGSASGIGIALRPAQIVKTNLRFTVPKAVKPGERISFDLVQRGEDGRIVGGITVQIRVGKRAGRKAGAKKKAAAKKPTATKKKKPGRKKKPAGKKRPSRTTGA